MSKVKEYLKQKLQNLPQKPGVYKFFDKDQELIYVGKAKNLKARVSSYFQSSSDHNYKTKRLVSLIRDLEFTIVDSEFDSMLLENSLIKENQPRYNIQLKDDKSFPYICILNERFPRIISTRRYKKVQGKYYGPYANVKALNTVLELIRKLYTIRTCSLDLSKENIDSGKYKICLEHHIGNCLGPCEGLQSEEEYLNNLKQAEHILKGNIHLCFQHFNSQMRAYSENYQYEKAEQVKQKLIRLEKFQSKTQIVKPDIDQLDVFSIVSEEKNAYINYFQIRNGSIIVTENILVKKKLDETDAEILGLTILSTREKFQSTSKAILTNIPIEYASDLNLVVPKIGDKKKLIDLSLKNALQYKRDKKATSEAKKESTEAVLKELQEHLKLPVLPNHIECFDNSNLQGTNPVASMVCFIDGRPAKKEYRHYNINTVEGPDDFSSMKEIVGRRYRRLLKEQKPLPKLIIVDGGKGQLSSACEALKEIGIYGKVPIVGIAKQYEEIFFPGDSESKFLDRKSAGLRLIQFIRNEAHRFAITFHRNQRSKNIHNTSLNDIPGIGKATEKLLITKYKTLQNIKSTPLEELNELIGAKRALAIRNYFGIDN